LKFFFACGAQNFHFSPYRIDPLRYFAERVPGAEPEKQKEADVDGAKQKEAARLDHEDDDYGHHQS
jgi:hypothetical protein